MKKLGLFSPNAVKQMQGGNECIEYADGVLLDNFIFYNSATNQYYLCLERPTTTWTSCYEVFIEDGSGAEIFDMWERLNAA